MKKHGFIILICLSLIFIIATKSYPDTEAGEILTVKGNVYLIRDARKDNAEPRMRILLKDTVETDRKSRTKLFFIDDSILNLGELSRIEIEEYLYSPEKKRSKSIYRLLNGLLKIVVGNSDLEIHTPTAVAAARGTKFIIWVEGSGKEMFTGIITMESEVVVKNIIESIAGEVTLKSGQMSRVYMGKPPEAVQPADIEIIRQLDGQTMVLGKTIKDTNITSGRLPVQAGEDLFMFQPPVSQEPATQTPVTIEVIFPE
ncbi:MAG TPA: hypothetical protein ENG83_00900 [Nitrospirae bacterium]|nr:fecR protein [bacterium BMS3Abin06]HDH10761.1 hypothetical protein [Nitrospirota bacterium]HDZ03049.1 hypothetical protein [Nitrospirota bacterium]